MTAGIAIAPTAPMSNIRLVCSCGCHADRATKKWCSALAATHTCGRQQNSLNTFATFMFTQMHALYAWTQNGPQVSRLTGGCAKVNSANDRSQAGTFNAYLERPYATTVRTTDTWRAHGTILVSTCIACRRQRGTEEFNRLHTCQIHCFLLCARRCKDKFAHHRIRRRNSAKWPRAHARSHVQPFAEFWSIAIRKRRTRDGARFTNTSEIHLP